mmetsp:Transcript_49468/g.115689  ORF Transcript_49468/g.115689 Transcript_49468/m.115689 type:complete len:1091 (+) Transcript_49468:144-3416(+)
MTSSTRVTLGSPRGSVRATSNPDMLVQLLTKMTDMAEFQMTMQDQIKATNAKVEKQLQEITGGQKQLLDKMRSLEDSTEKVRQKVKHVAENGGGGPVGHIGSNVSDDSDPPTIGVQRSTPYGKTLTQAKTMRQEGSSTRQKGGTMARIPSHGQAHHGHGQFGRDRDDDEMSFTGSQAIHPLGSELPIQEEVPIRASKVSNDSDNDETNDVVNVDPLTKARASLRAVPRPSAEGAVGSHTLGSYHLGPEASTTGATYQKPEQAQGGTSAGGGVVHAEASGLTWPATLEPRSEFNQKKAEPTSRDELLNLIFRNKVKQSREARDGEVVAKLEGGDANADAAPIRTRFTIHPDSMLRVAWDTASVLVLMADMALVPFVLSWHVQMGEAWVIFSIATFFFWCTDMFMSFITGVYERGTLFMQLHEIAHHYVHGWFMLDASILLVDLVAMAVLAVQGQHTRMGQVLRGAKLIRLIRVTRLVKLFESVLQRNISDTVRIVIQISQQVVWIVWTTHILCCAWYAIGKFAPTDTGERWLDAQAGDANYEHADMAYQYFTALHWGASQIAAGNMDVQPLSTFERGFNTLCLVFGLIVGSALVSSLSATMMDLREARQEQTKQLRLLRQYMVQNNIEAETMVRMQKHAMDRMMNQRLKDEDVPALQLLSASLQQELRWASFRPSLVTHAFFRLIEMLDNETFRKLCNSAVEFIYPSYGDEVFTVGEKAIGAVFMVFGKAQYIQHPASAMVEEEQITDLEEGTIAAEASLFSMWIHVGSAISSFSCQIMRIRGRSFARTINRNSLTHEVCIEYASRFYTSLTNARPPHASFPTDLHVPFTGFSEVILSMAQPYQEAISRITFETFQLDQQRHAGLFGGSGKGLQELEDEVRSGSCTLLENGRGETERVVALCVLRVEDENGHIFVHIGTWEGEGASPKVKLPGAKQKAGEMSSDTVARVLKSDLKVMKDKVELAHTEQVTETKESASYHINTIYLKTIQYAMITGPFECTKFVCSFSLTGGSEVDAHGSYVPLVPSRDIFVIPDGKKYGMYTWLRQEEFDFLSSPGGPKALGAILDRVRAEPNISELVENSATRRNVSVVG